MIKRLCDCGSYDEKILSLKPLKSHKEISNKILISTSVEVSFARESFQHNKNTLNCDSTIELRILS